VGCGGPGAAHKPPRGLLLVCGARPQRPLTTLDQDEEPGLRGGTARGGNSRRGQLIALSARYMMPAIYKFREFPLAGGLMSYGTNLATAYHQVGVYTAKILKVSPRQKNDATDARPNTWLHRPMLQT
jgi:hypothetical protein